MNVFSYFLGQLTCCLMQLVPVSVLLYTPFSDGHLKARKRVILPAAVGIMTSAGILITAVLTGFFEKQDIPDQVFLCLSEGMFLMTGIAGTILYIFSFRPGTHFRVFGYFVSLHYGIISYALARTAGKMGAEDSASPFNLPSLAAYGVCLLVLFPMVYEFLKRFGCFSHHKRNRRIQQLVTGNSVMLFLLYTIVLLAEITLFLVTKYRVANLYVVIWLIGILITNLAVYGVFFLCLHNQEEKESFQVKLAAYELQSHSFNDKIQEDKRTIHNMRHHIRLLVSLLEKKQYGAAEKYLKKYLNEWEDHNTRKISENPLLNTILGYYITQAENENIRIFTDIQVKPQYPFDIMDMTVLFGNAMENALEGCRDSHVPDPTIRIEICQRRQTLLIRIVNSCQEDALRKNPITGIPNSSKKGRIWGYGIQSMKMIAEKYQGSLEYRKDGKEFTLQVMLNIPEETGGRKA